jgi:hypothetical protein
MIISYLIDMHVAYEVLNILFLKDKTLKTQIKNKI